MVILLSASDTLDFFKNDVSLAIEYFNNNENTATSSLINKLGNDYELNNINIESMRQSLLDVRLSHLGSII